MPNDVNGADLYPVFTVGYQRRTPEELGRVLVGAGVRALVDIRDRALSRRSGLAKSQMPWWLGRLTPPVRYHHFRSFGVWASARARLASGATSWADFTSEYERHLDVHDDELLRLADVVIGQPTALLAWAHEAARCHRSLLARRLNERFEEVDGVRHL